MRSLRHILFLQLSWAFLCILWNFYGLWLVSKGSPPIGPTASWAIAGLNALFFILFILFKKINTNWPYLLLSVITALLAAIAVYGGFTKDASLWPNAFWRWLGIIINFIGLLGGVLAILNQLSHKNLKSGI